MAKDKSILDKFTETVKGFADSASQALKAEEPARVDETSAAYMLPFAAQGLVSDPLLVPPIASQPVRRKKRATKKSARGAAAKTARKQPAKKAAKKSARKTKTSTRARTKAVAGKSAEKTSRKAGKRAGARKTSGKSRR